MAFDASSAVLESAPSFDAESATPEFDADSAVEESRGATAASADSSPAGVGSIPTPAITEAAGAVSGAIGQEPRLGPEEPTREELRQLPPWDTRRIKAAESLSDLQALETEAQRRPLVPIPKPGEPGFGVVANIATAGLSNLLPPLDADTGAGVRSVIGAAESMGTPENIGMIATGALAAPLGIMRPISTYFAATMGKEAAGGAVSAATALAEGDLTKAGEELAAAGTMGLMAVGAGAHAIGETRGAATVRERAETSAITEATKLREQAAVTDAQRQTDARLDSALAEAEKLAEPAATAIPGGPIETGGKPTTVETPGAPGIAATGKAPAAEPAPSIVEQIRERLESDDFTLRDAANEIVTAEDAPPELKRAAQDVLDAVKEDRETFGERSGLPEEAEDALEKMLRNYQAPKAGSLRPTEAAEVDVSAIRSAKTQEEMLSAGGKMFATAKTDAELQQIQAAMKSWEPPPAEITRQQAESPEARNKFANQPPAAEGAPAPESVTMEIPPGYKGGPGAAGPVEAGEMTAERGKIGGYNADVEARQKARGQTPTMSEARKEDPVTWENAMAQIEAKPDAPEALVERIHEDPKKPITDEEQQMLTWRRGDLENKMAMEAERAADPNLSPDEQALAQSQAEFFERQLLRTEQANRMAGTASGRSLRSRQMEMNDDYTFAGIMMRARKQKGDVLTAEEKATIKQQADEIAALKTRAEEGERNAARTQVLEATIADLEKTVAARPAFGKEVFDIARKKVAEWKAAADEVDADIRSYLGSETGAVGDVGPQKGRGLKLSHKASERAFITKVALKMRAKIGELGLDFAESSAALIAEYGAAIQPYLQKAWVAAQKMIGKETNPKVRNAIKEGVSKPRKGEKTPTDVRARAKAEASAKMELSNRTAYEAVRAVINSGVKGELEIMNGALNLLKESYPDLTLEKLDVAFSEYGMAKYPSTEATKVELAKLRRLRQMQAAIEDVKKRGETAKSGVQRAKADADVRKRQKELKDAIEEYGKEKPTTPEQLANQERARLSRAENAIADLDLELRTGEARIKAEPKMPSKELEQLQSELAAMRELKKEIEDAKNPPKTEAEKQIETLSKQREKLDKVLSGEETPKSPKEWQALSDAAADIKAEIQAMQELAAQMRRDAKPKKDPEYAKEQARIKALEDSIARYSDRTNRLDFSAPPKTQMADSARVAALKEIRDSRRAAYDAAKKAGRPVRTESEIYNATRAKSIERQFQAAEKRIREGDFAPRAKKVQPELTKENLDAKARLEAKKQEVRRGEEAFRLAQRTKMRKVWDGIKQGKQAFVNIISSLDLSAPRQGLLYLLGASTRIATRPGMIGRPFRNMIQALFSKAGADRIKQRTEARINRKNGVDKMSGVQFQDYDNTRFTKGEENAHSILDEWANESFRTGSTGKTLARAIPLAGAKAVHASNRAFVTFLNSARAELLDHLLAVNFKDRPPTPAEIKAVGDMVNLATGRANMNPKVASALGYTGLWSPNLLISRLQALTGQPLVGSIARGEGRAAKIVAKEYARVIASVYILYKTAQLFNEDDEEKESTSSDFGKIIRKGEGGDTRVDLWGGFQQQTVLANRFRKAESTNLAGKTRKLSGQDLGTTLFKFYRSKLRPDVGIAADILLRENYKGDKTTLGSVAKSAVPVPLSMQELLPLLKAHGLSEAAALQALQMFGAGVSNYADDAKAEKARAR